MKRSPMKQGKTKRLSDFDREFEKMKPIVHERSGGRCEVPRFLDDLPRTTEVKDAAMMWLTSVDHDYRAAHVHHRKYRGRSRGGTNALSNLLDVCEPCHLWIHAHGGFEQQANLLGLALSVGESEDL